MLAPYSRKLIFAFSMIAVVMASVVGIFTVEIHSYLARVSTGVVISDKKLSSFTDSISALLEDGDQFGSGMADIGDLDGDGVRDLAVGAWKDDDGGTNFGAVYILFMYADGTVKNYQKVSMASGAFTGPIDSADDFGFGVYPLGDLDLDGVEDIVVSERANDNGGTDRGAFYVLFLNSDGTVKAEQRISDTSGSFTGVLDNFDVFGETVAVIPDVNGDGIDDLAVGAKQDDDGGIDRGTIWILYMQRDGSVSGYHKINSISGGMNSSALDNGDRFGASVASVADMNADGVRDLIVGASLDDDGAADTGAIYVLFMNADGTVASQAKISSLTVNFTDAIHAGDRFGAALAAIGDLDQDGIDEVLVGAWADDAPGADSGAAYVLFLNAEGGVRRYQKMSGATGVLTGLIDAGDNFGLGLSVIDDLNGSGVPELIVGAVGDDDGGTDRGALWLLYLQQATGSAWSSSYPSHVSMTLNDGASCTTSREIQIHLEAEDADTVILSNDVFFRSSVVLDFSETEIDHIWQLPPDDAVHTVYAVFRSPSKDFSIVQSQTIRLDQTNNCVTLDEMLSSEILPKP